jgi:thymidylate synthase (FAD)
MKLIKQSFEFINQTDFSLVGIKKHIERCARVSYKSEDKITDTSYEKFVNMLESRGHDRPLEFGTVHLKMSTAQLKCLQTLLLMNKVYNDYWIKYNIIDTEDNCYITTNYRYYMELCRYDRGISEYLDFSDSPFYPKRYTVHMILDRGVMDEFRTHVGLSHLAESTRYCNYSKDKFGNEITFIKPCWCNIPEGDYDTPDYTPDRLPRIGAAESGLIDALQYAEYYYFFLLSEGWTPQQARSVLPLSIKSELISCGFEDVWTNFFYRRDAPDAHPMAQEIAKPMHQKFIELTEMK